MNRVLMAAVVATLVVAGATTAVAADDHFSIELTPAVDTPDRTAEVDSETFPVSSVGRVAPGESFEAHVTAPERSYEVVVYDSFRNEQAARAGSGEATVSFDTDGWTPGSYMVSVEDSTGVVAIQPLVVSAYDLDVTSTAQATPGSWVRVTADLESTGGGPTETRVVALISGDRGEKYERLQKNDDGTYVTTMAIDRLPPGEYSVYVVVQGSKVSYGARETIALTDARPLTVGTPTETEATPGEEDVPTETPQQQVTEAATTAAGAPATGDVGAASSDDVEARAADQTLEAAGLSNGAIVPLAVVAMILLLLVANRFR